MSIILPYILILILIGITFFVFRSIQTNNKEQITNKVSEIQAKESLIGQLQEQLRLQNNEVTELKIENRSLSDKLEIQKSEIAELQNRMRQEFKLMANEILEEKSTRFTELNKQNIGQILSPLNERLNDFKKQVEESYDKEVRDRKSLEGEIKRLIEQSQRLGQEANNLSRALKSDSKTQGNWGEMILESILDHSGLTQGREYFREETLTDEMNRTLLNEKGKRMRPDVIVRYPDGRYLIIDAKVSLTAYTRYIETEDELVAQQALKEHLISVRNHVKELIEREYQKNIEGALDRVMMFIPIESAFMVAIKQDPNLWQEAFDKGIIILSPTNLIMTLKLVEELWTRDKQNKNMLRIADQGTKLYDKFVGFLDNMTKIGGNIETLQKSYSSAMSQMKEGRGNLISQVEKLKQLGVKSQKTLPDTILAEEEDIEE